MTRAALALTVLFAAAQIGCAAAAPIVMDASEYGVYRRARASERLEDRLAASQEYLTKFPGGVYSADVRTFFTTAEPLYFAGAQGSIDGLEGYLRALPRGPSAGAAQQRLGYLRARRDAEGGDLAGAAETTSASLAREAERRRGVRSRIRQWLRLLLDARTFAAPMVDAPAELIVPWSLGLPWPICERTGDGPDAPRAPAGPAASAARRCTKLLQLDYRATEEGEAQERQALVEITVWQDEAGRPLEMTLGGPDLFLRLDETVTARGALATDPEARLRGAEIAVAMARTTFEIHVSADASCQKQADSDVLRLACNGLELRVLAGALDGDDDRFVVRAAR